MKSMYLDIRISKQITFEEANKDIRRIEPTAVCDILKLGFFDRRRAFRSCIYELECKICSHRGWFGLVQYRSLVCKLARGKCNNWNGRNCVDQNLSQDLSGSQKRCLLFILQSIRCRSNLPVVTVSVWNSHYSISFKALTIWRFTGGFLRKPKRMI